LEQAEWEIKFTRILNDSVARPKDLSNQDVSIVNLQADGSVRIIAGFKKNDGRRRLGSLALCSLAGIEVTSVATQDKVGLPQSWNTRKVPAQHNRKDSYHRLTTPLPAGGNGVPPPGIGPKPSP